ncbi:hypothetical protein [Actinomadura sp. 6N118]|uniref:hypothetical protein n=1 Tax=Actinomadura sp. 6N118 TaxID=3375151 RepID=UPI0037AE3E59
MIITAGAAESASTTTAWFTLAGALGGVLITGCIALASAVLSHRWQVTNSRQQLLQEHHQQLRQERREAFVHYWAAWNRFNYQLKALRDAVKELHQTDTPPSNPRKHLEEAAPQLVQDALEREMNWREAADAIFLIATSTVTRTAAKHVEITDQKIAAAWQGVWVSDRTLGAARTLNDAMRDELLTPTPP